MKTADGLGKGLDVIQRKLERVDRLESTYSQVSKALCGKKNVTPGELLQAVYKLKNSLEQVKRERDAAVHDLANSCTHCKFIGQEFDESTCKSCFQKQHPFSPAVRTKFEWRGVCEENTEEESPCSNS